MKIKIEALKQQLKNNSSGIFLLSGDDPYLKIQCKNDIVQHYQHQQEHELEKYNIDSHFNWQYLIDNALSFSLFTQSKILDCRFQQNKPNQQQQQGLCDLLENRNPDTVIILDFPKLDSSCSRQSWYKTIKNAGTHIEIWPIDASQFPGWIKQRLKAAKLPQTPALIQALCELTSGNLLAAQQEINKLSLLGNDEQALINSIDQSSKFSIFDLVQQCLTGNLSKARTTLDTLQAEGAEQVLILWALAQEIRLACNVQQRLSKKEPMQSICQSLYIWPKRRQAIQRYCQRFNQSDSFEHLQSCANIDKVIKGQAAGNAWFCLLQLITSICGVRVCAT